MQQLVYTSRAIEALESGEIFRIIETSARNNPQREITGFLAFAGDRFVQLVEGPEVSLDLLLAELKEDSRHRDLEILDRRETTRRSFPNWRMERLVASHGNTGKLVQNLRLARVPSAAIARAVAHLRPVAAA